METGDYETNALLVNNISNITYRIYEPSQDLILGSPSAALELENSLRHAGHLVLYDSARKGIWYFRMQEKDASGHPLDANPIASLDAHIQVLGYSLSVVEEGAFEPNSIQKGRTGGPQLMKPAPANTSSTGSGFAQGLQSPHQLPLENGLGTAQKTVYENFISAILFAISAAFCTASEAIPLNYRTVLLSTASLGSKDDEDTGSDHGAVLGTFGAYLTTVGSLIVSFSVSQCQALLSLDNFFTASLTPPGQRVLAAPFGILAKNPAASMGELGTASLAQTPNTQALSIRGYPEINDGFWKQTCLKILQLRGIPASILENCSWVNVTVPRRRLQDHKNDGLRSKENAWAAIPWPGLLCFRQRAFEGSSVSRLGGNILSGREEHRDPLGRAGHWLDSTSEREEQISRRRANRLALNAPEHDGHALRPQAIDGQTALALGRPSTAIAGAMYPTPPDGIQPSNGITPTFDPTLSSPRNPFPAPPIADIDAVMQTEPGSSNRGQIGDSKETKRERSDSNLLESDENMLMGGGDMFGEDDDDITEADFNFFDEQPGETDEPIADLEVQVPEPQKQPAIAVEDEQQFPVSEAPNPPQPPPESGVFMKPELKDARSFLNEPPVARPISEKSSAAVRSSSPFDSTTVFKQIRASLIQPNGLSSSAPETRKRKASVFEKLDFGAALPMINKKYEKGGLFDFDPAPLRESRSSLPSGPLPETEYLKRHGRRNRKPRESGQSKALMTRFTALGAPTSHPSPSKRGASMSDDDQSSVESDQDDTSYASDEPISPLKSSMRRLAVDDDTVSNMTSLREPEGSDETDQRLALDLPRLVKPDLPETPLSKIFQDPEPLNLELPLTDDDVIQIAQLVTEQATTGAIAILDTPQTNNSSVGGRGSRQHLATTTRQSMKILQNVMPHFVRGLAPSCLKALLEVPDVPAAGHTRGMQPRPVPGREVPADHLRPNCLYHIPNHHLEVRRSDTKLSMLPSAISFWESLGLGPASGSKNTQAICAYPNWDGMMENVTTFLERMKSIYELLKLGTFEQLSLPSDIQDGLLPYEVDRISTSPDASVTRQGSTLIESLGILHTAISDASFAHANLVIFMIYAPTNPGMIIESCLAFQRFFETYKKTLATKHEYPQNELVLQLVSADMISSPSSLVVTPTSDLFKLCMEMYDRCTLFDGPMPAPGIILEQALPRIIDFKLTNPPSASLMHENSCIYVAYAQSLDDRWISAAWTDDRGFQQATASYCLGRKGRPLSATISSIVHEIWESTLDLISHRKVHWRVIITKSGAMDAAEVEYWSDLARVENRANVAMALTTVDTCPWLQLIPPVAQLPLSSAGLYTTPVTTPQANVVSPEAIATPATPMRDMNQPAAQTPGTEGGGEAEGAAALIDLTDQTWGAVLGHRLNNSTTLLELQPALVSGYLVKKTGAQLEDAPAVMEVNLIHTENTARAYEPLFREILSNFKGLGTLARARGVVRKETDVRPWHVAAAEKAVRALYMLM